MKIRVDTDQISKMVFSFKMVQGEKIKLKINLDNLIITIFSKMLPLSNNSCYICIHNLYAKCKNHYGTEVAIIYNFCPIIVIVSVFKIYTLKCTNYYGTEVVRSDNLYPIIVITFANTFYTLNLTTIV